jgi:RHS repeat-associated protein
MAIIWGKENRYLYNGKEQQQALGLGWYYYGARMYDPSIGRSNGVDAMADQRNWLTPYNYVQGNPITRTDPTGNLDWDVRLT